VLRLTTEVGNTGRGPLDLRPRPGDCDGDGDPSNDRFAYQRIYVDANGDGAFEPRLDTAFHDRLAGCMNFHPAHDHWHFRGFAGYSLVNERNGRTVSEATKVSFCVIDTDPRWPRLPGFDQRGAYIQCGAKRPQGLGVGWADIYGAGLPGQALDITHVGPGRYCVVLVADPQDRMLELDEGNNAAGARIVLGPSGQVHSTHRGCSPPGLPPAG